MKNFTDDEIKKIGEDLFGSEFDGNIRTSLTVGKHTIETVGKGIPHTMGNGGTWYPVIFKDGESCSLKTLLRAKGIKWTSPSLKTRLKAMDGKELDVKSVKEEHVPETATREGYDRKVITVSPIEI